MYIETYLCVKWKGVEAHWTDECDVSGLRVEYVVVGGNPKTRMFGQHFHHFECFEVVYEDVRKPQLVDQLQIDGDHGVWRRGVQLT